MHGPFPDILQGSSPPGPAEAPTHAHLLDALVRLNFSVVRLTAEFNLTAPQLAAFARDPDIRASLDELRAFAAEFGEIAHGFSAGDAIQALVAIAANAEVPSHERLRAAALILRPSTPRPTYPLPRLTFPDPAPRPPSTPTTPPADRRATHTDLTEAPAAQLHAAPSRPIPIPAAVITASAAEPAPMPTAAAIPVPCTREGTPPAHLNSG